MSGKAKTFEEYQKVFWSQVKKTNSCWEWQGAKDGKGYGKIWRDGKHLRCHRVSYELKKGTIPSGMLVCHHCDNKICVRPSHLFVGSHKDNMQDWTKKGKNRLVNDRSLWRTGDLHWTRSKSTNAKNNLKKIALLRKIEWSSGKRVAIRDSKGRIMGTRILA